MRARFRQPYKTSVVQRRYLPARFVFFRISVFDSFPDVFLDDMQQPFLCNIQGWVGVRLWKNVSFTCQWDRPTKVLKCLGFPHTRLTARFETREKHDQSPSPQFFLFIFYCRNPVWRVTVLVTVQLNKNCSEIKDVPPPIGAVRLFWSSSIGRVFLWDLTVNHSLLFFFFFFFFQALSTVQTAIMPILPLSSLPFCAP